MIKLHEIAVYSWFFGTNFANLPPPLTEQALSICILSFASLDNQITGVPTIIRPGSHFYLAFNVLK